MRAISVTEHGTHKHHAAVDGRAQARTLPHRDGQRSVQSCGTSCAEDDWPLSGPLSALGRPGRGRPLGLVHSPFVQLHPPTEVTVTTVLVHSSGIGGFF